MASRLPCRESSALRTYGVSSPAGPPSGCRRISAARVRSTVHLTSLSAVERRSGRVAFGRRQDTVRNMPGGSLSRPSAPRDGRARGRAVDEPRIGALIVNWNRRDDLLRCLASLAASERNRPHHLRLLVADNASPDGSG